MAQVQRDMTLYYEGTDITDDVDIIECVCRDVSGGACDCLNMRLDHAEKWLQWNPQKNDKLRVTRSGYDSKTLYLNTVMPENGMYRIYATSSKCVPFPAKWQSFEKKTLQYIMSVCAGECGMGTKLFGISGGITYKYMLRHNMSAPAFLEMLVNREGAMLKALDGCYTAIGVTYAQGMAAMHEMQLDDDHLDSEYIDRRDLSWAGVQIKTPFGSGIARDANARGQMRVLTDITVDDAAQAYRWAKGILLMHNRQSETLNIAMDFNPGYTAMVRVNVNSAMGAAGAWLVDEVEQNLVDGRTHARMLRCVTGIG